MKKSIKYLLFVLLFSICLIPCSVFASGESFTISSSNNSVTVGQTFTVTITASSNENIMSYEYMLSYGKGIVQLISGNDYTHSEPSGGMSESKSFTFKAISAGNTTISLTGYIMGTQSKDFNSNEIRLVSSNIVCNSATINPPSGGSTSGSGSSSGSSSGSGSANNQVFSTNNNLSALGVDGNKISPDFNKDVLEYTLDVSDEIEKINITATAEDQKASISGIGEKTLDYGDNKYEIVVTSEKGTTKTYVLIVKVKDDNPISVKLGNEEYNIVKRASLLAKMDKYEASTIKISDQDVPCLVNTETGDTLVALKNVKTGNISLFIYDKEQNSYKSFIKLGICGLSLTIIDKDSTFKNYNKYTISIDGIDVPVFRLNDSSNFAVFYATDNSSGESGYYMYDMKMNTVIHYDEDELNGYVHLVSLWKKIIIGLNVSTLICFLLFIFVLIKKNKMKKRIRKEEKQINLFNNNLNEKKKNELFTDDAKEDKQFDIIEKKDEKTIINKNKVKDSSEKLSKTITKPVDLKEIELEQNLKVKDQKAVRTKEKEKEKKEKIERIIKNSNEKNKKKLSDTQILDKW